MTANLVILVGNLGKDPDLRYMPNGDAVANLTIATSESWKDKSSGEKKEQTEWHRVVMFRRLAEIAGEFLRKGSQVYIEGKLHTNKYEKDGQTHYSTEIRADTMKMIGKRPEGSGEQESSRAPRQAPPAKEPGGFSDFDSDIPF